MTTVIFDIRRDNELIAAGAHFWCEAHRTAQPLEKQSPDPRYCQDCFDFFMTYEVPILSPKAGRPKWVPVPAPGANETEKTLRGVVEYVGGNMSTVNGKKITVDILQPTAQKTTLGNESRKTGPKSTKLPEDLIRQWASDGMGSKAIAARLKDECRFEISYKTIQRRLQRVLI